MAPNGPTGAYFVQSSFVSSRPYGFLSLRDELTRWRMASDRADAWQVAASAPALDYVVAPGRAPARDPHAHRPHRAPARAAALGAAARSSTGSCASRRRRRGVPARGRAATSTDIQRYRPAARRLPDRGLGVHPPPDAAPPDRALPRARHPRAALLPRLRRPRRDRHRPPGAASTRRSGGATSRRERTGSPTSSSRTSSPTAPMIDFTDPAALRWWTRRIHEALDLGADGFMQDFGEQVPAGHALRRRLDRARRCTTACRCSSTARRARAIDSYRARAPRPRRRLLLHPRRLLGRPARCATRARPGPGDETTDWSRSAGLASQAPGHAQPRHRRRVRLRHRHRRLLRRRPHADDEGAVPALGRSGRRSRRSSACTARSPPAPTRRGATTRETVRIYRACRGCTCAAAPLIARAVARGGADRACRSRGRCGSRRPGDRRAARAGPGMDARPRRAGGAGRRGGRSQPHASTSRAGAGRTPETGRRFARAAPRGGWRRRWPACPTSSAAARGRSVERWISAPRRSIGMNPKSGEEPMFKDTKAFSGFSVDDIPRPSSSTAKRWAWR